MWLALIRRSSLLQDYILTVCVSVMCWFSGSSEVRRLSVDFHENRLRMRLIFQGRKEQSSSVHKRLMQRRKNPRSVRIVASVSHQGPRFVDGLLCCHGISKSVKFYISRSWKCNGWNGRIDSKVLCIKTKYKSIAWKKPYMYFCVSNYF